MDKLYTIIEVATKLNLSDKTLRRWEEAGRFTPSRTLGNQRRYSLEDLQILDAIKHGTITDQKDLLNIEQASKICGVSPTTIVRWEDQGRIHPFITSGNTYYIRQRLLEKMDELKKIAPEKAPEPISEPIVRETNIQTEFKPKLSPLPSHPLLTTAITPPTPFNLQASLFNILITIILIASYHLIFNVKSTSLVSPSSKTGSVQGASTLADPTLDLLHTILSPSGALTTTTLTSRTGLVSPVLSLSPSSAPDNPTPGTVYYDAASQSLKIFKGSAWSELSPTLSYKVGDSSLIVGSGVLHKGKNQISIPHDKITLTTPVTVTFTTDYAPAKKYWVTVDPGSFTLHTDFPVAADSPFNYNLLTSNLASPAAATISSPSATLR